MSNKKDNNHLQYIYRGTYQKRTVRQHVVTDKGKEVAERTARNRLCHYLECQWPDLKDFKLIIINDMEGNTVEEN